MTGNDPLASFRDGAVATGTGRPIPLVSTRIGVRIVGGLAVVTTVRVFRNAEDGSIEATVTFPVPVHATLVGLGAEIGGRRLAAAARRRGAAREAYEAAIDDGRTAVLHEEVLRGVHMLSVGHVPPGGEIAVTGVWADTLASVDGAVSLRIPTTVGDVYGRSPLPDSDDLVHAPINHRATLEVACEDGEAHLVGGALRDGKAEVALDAPIDLAVTGWAPRDLAGIAADGRAVTLGAAPAPEGGADLDVEILADVSGSMDDAFRGSREGGTKLAEMLRGLAGAARALRATDRVRLWQFNHAVKEVGRAAGGAGFEALLARVGGPSGGTAVGPALDVVAGRSEAPDILLVTDGKSYDIDVQALARTGKRFTVVLIGEDSLEANVGHLAALTGGEIFVTGAADAAAAIRAAAASLRAPHLSRPRIEGPPDRVRTRRGGMLVGAAWGAKADGAGVGSAEEGGDVPDLARIVGAVAAAMAIPAMDEEAAAAMAEAHGIVSHLTSLVLVDEEGVRQEGLPAQRKVPLSTPRTATRVAMMAAAPAGLATGGFDLSLEASSPRGPGGSALFEPGDFADLSTPVRRARKGGPRRPRPARPRPARAALNGSRPALPRRAAGRRAGCREHGRCPRPRMGGRQGGLDARPRRPAPG